MEIEAKFAVPDQAILQKLSQTTELDGFQLTPGSAKTVQDSYRDTASRMIYKSGYACRIRRKAGKNIATLKGLGHAVGSVHERAEYEVTLDAGDSPHDWPQGEARALVLSLCEDQEISELFTVNQQRTTRNIVQENRTIAELSLDVVYFSTGAQTHESFEVEVELLQDGTRDDLQKIVHDLEDNWHLQPQSLSKFERGLKLFDTISASAPESLSTEEHALLQEIAQTGNPMHARRAQLLLLNSQGLKSTDIAPHVGISDRQVRHWVQRFREDHMLVFPERVVTAASAAIATKPTPPTSTDAVPLSPSTESELLPPVQFGETRDWTARLSDTSVLPDDSMSEAGRKVLRLHFSRMLEHEKGTRLGKDIEELHDMRVATRRMRSAFDVFALYYDPKILRPFMKDLKRVGRALGHVRDLDVFMQKAQRYIDQTIQEQPISLAPLIENWKTQRELERVEMLRTLDSKAYRRFIQSFGTFLVTEGAGALPVSAGRPTAYQVYQLVPTLIYSRYEVIRGYEPLLMDAPIETLHALRIEFKKLRYALEFFREVLGPEVKDVIKEVVIVQDHLGDLNDADVACNVLISFLQGWIQEDHRERIEIDGVTRYLLDKQLELRTLVDTFPQTWQHFNRQELRRNLAMAISVL